MAHPRLLAWSRAIPSFASCKRAPNLGPLPQAGSSFPASNPVFDPLNFSEQEASIPQITDFLPMVFESPGSHARKARIRKPPRWESTVTRENPAAVSLANADAGWTGTKVLFVWMTRLNHPSG